MLCSIAWCRVESRNGMLCLSSAARYPVTGDCVVVCHTAHSTMCMCQSGFMDNRWHYVIMLPHLMHDARCTTSSRMKYHVYRRMHCNGRGENTLSSLDVCMTTLQTCKPEFGHLASLSLYIYIYIYLERGRQREIHVNIHTDYVS